MGGGLKLVLRGDLTEHVMCKPCPAQSGSSVKTGWYSMCGERGTCGFGLGLDSALLCAVKTCWNQVLCALRLHEEHGE